MAHEKNHDYHILPPSPWPFYGAVSAFVMLIGVIIGFKAADVGERTPADYWLGFIGFLGCCYVAYNWWADMVSESKAGDHSKIVQIGLRLGVILFIISEVMFFSAWFWNFFKHAIFPVPDIEGSLTPTLQMAVGAWPPEGIVTFDPWDLPLLNTLILLLSGCTVTWAHHALLEDDRPPLLYGLMATVALGAIFTMFQAYEYSHAEFGFSGNIYGASFFMATGFHGAHVLIGTVFLFVCLMRARAGQFTAEKHLGFEAAAWYWHFVDVVWLFLFFCIYIWGA